MDPANAEHANVERFLEAISTADLDSLRALCTLDVELKVPGSMTADLTREGHGIEALCEWTQTIRRLCGVVRLDTDRELYGEAEVMATGQLTIDKMPRSFRSPCFMHFRFSGNSVSSFALLCDTFALEQFRGD